MYQAKTFIGYLCDTHLPVLPLHSLPGMHMYLSGKGYQLNLEGIRRFQRKEFSWPINQHCFVLVSSQIFSRTIQWNWENFSGIGKGLNKTGKDFRGVGKILVGLETISGPGKVRAFSQVLGTVINCLLCLLSWGHASDVLALGSADSVLPELALACFLHLLILRL